ncbi:AIR synthase-related protein [Curtobacterium sp. MCJR17_043]|uniref:AIR synthase-related protein n=1 Tax=Curtobacterium sp. MCJR17_043 TaxID=2175660 RepID=UPI0032E8CA15
MPRSARSRPARSSARTSCRTATRSSRSSPPDCTRTGTRSSGTSSASAASATRTRCRSSAAWWGEALLEPTRLYTSPLLDLIEQHPGAVHSLSHVTGGGIAANLARVLPVGSWVEVERSTWQPLPVFRVLADLAGTPIEDTEGTWNLGIGMFAVVSGAAADEVIATLGAAGLPAWTVGSVSTGARDLTGFEQGAKGVDGGAVRLVGSYAG